MNEAIDNAERLRRIRFRMGWDGLQMGNALGVTREWVSKLENGRAEPSELILRKLDEIENSMTLRREQSLTLSEQHAPYSAKIAPTFTSGSVSEPTDQQLVDYFLNSLAVARQVPGGRGYVWSQLKLNLSPEQIKRLAE